MSIPPWGIDSSNRCLDPKADKTTTAPNTVAFYDSSMQPIRSPIRFPIRVGRRSWPVLMFFGVRPDNAWLELDDDLDVRFGWFRFRTPMSNLESWRLEGPFLWITAIGVRMSIRHGDVTFGGSPHGGVRIDFHEPVKWGPRRVPAIYVPADDLGALAAELESRGIHGHDARRRA